ncbi:MAG: hypothetical protein KAR20_29430, partial [Candidatus Heimdallarchaeota archaeon]|nr:hypothetical protein [Candidatus Heimdallarchaeota archaeon]
MDDVMVFYSIISKNSNIIRLALETLTKEQLKNFSLLYRYECFSIKAAVLLTLAFSEITPHNEEREKKVFLDAFEDLWGFKLFNFSGGVNVLEDLLEKSINELSQVEYSFIGDPIDKLYAAYFYEDLTGEKLESNCEYLFEDMLAIKYGNQLQSSGISVIDGSIPVFSTADEIKIYNVNFDKSDTYDSGENIINDLDRLVDLSSEDNIKDSDKIKEIKDLSSKYDLAFPSFMAEKLELLGYYYVISDLKIKGKRRIVNNLFPVKDFDGIIPSIKKVFSSPGNIFDGLDEYMVEVNNIFIYWMPRKPLVAIFLFDIQGELDSLIQRVKNRNFDGAINSADRILKLDTRFIKNEVRTRVETLNNYGFCLININSLERAKSILESCGKHFLVSRCNLAYIHFLNGETELTKEILNRIIKKNSGHDH